MINKIQVKTDGHGLKTDKFAHYVTLKHLSVLPVNRSCIFLILSKLCVVFLYGLRPVVPPLYQLILYCEFCTIATMWNIIEYEDFNEKKFISGCTNEKDI